MKHFVKNLSFMRVAKLKILTENLSHSQGLFPDFTYFNIISPKHLQKFYLFSIKNQRREHLR